MGPTRWQSCWNYPTWKRTQQSREAQGAVQPGSQQQQRAWTHRWSLTREGSDGDALWRPHLYHRDPSQTTCGHHQHHHLPWIDVPASHPTLRTSSTRSQRC